MRTVLHLLFFAKCNLWNTLVNTHRQGLGAAYPPAPGSSSTVQSGRIMNQQRPLRTSNSNHFGGFGMKIDPLTRPAQCPQTCDLTAWPKCQCVSPATYSDDGRGNCNVGAMKIDLQVVQELFCKSHVTPAFIFIGMVLCWPKYWQSTTGRYLSMLSINQTISMRTGLSIDRLRMELQVCPDSRPSDSKPGYFWSRFACITETIEEWYCSIGPLW